MATIDYMIASYGPYSASATGGNGLARDLLAGVAAMYSMPCKYSCGVTFSRVIRELTSCLVYTDIPSFGRLKLVWPTVILGFLALLVTIPIFVFYWKGPAIRARSRFAQTLASDRKTQGERRRSAMASVAPTPEPKAPGQNT